MAAKGGAEGLAGERAALAGVEEDGALHTVAAADVLERPLFSPARRKEFALLRSANSWLQVFSARHYPLFACFFPRL